MQLLTSPPPQGDELREALHEYATEYESASYRVGPIRRPCYRAGSTRAPQHRAGVRELARRGYGGCHWEAVHVVGSDSHKDPQHLQWAKEHLPYTPLKGASQNGGEHWYYRATDLDVPTTQLMDRHSWPRWLRVLCGWPLRNGLAWRHLVSWL